MGCAHSSSAGKAPREGRGPIEAAAQASRGGQATTASTQATEGSREAMRHTSTGDTARRKKKSSYRFTRVLGRGAFGKVYLATTETHRKVAVKVIKVDRLDGHVLARARRERDILASLEHPNIVRFIESFEDQQRLYIVTEYIRGGELYGYVETKKNYTVAHVRGYAKTLLEALRYCHGKGVIHRDIKPQNILLSSRDDRGTLILCDFGVSCKLDPKTMDTASLETMCGTVGYRAPEMLAPDQPYDAAVDIWSMGVVTFFLLTGCPPFYATTLREVLKQIRDVQYIFQDTMWNTLPETAKEFVLRMLVADPKKRATLDELLQHAFLLSEDDQDITVTLPYMKRWNAKRRVSLLRNVFNAMNRFKLQGKNVTKDVGRLSSHTLGAMEAIFHKDPDKHDRRTETRL